MVRLLAFQIEMSEPYKLHLSSVLSYQFLFDSQWGLFENLLNTCCVPGIVPEAEE